jgi:prepilin-type N-terminal cleavage/methylation domain-containing protein
MNARKLTNEDGVSLIELLVAVSILGVLMTVLASALFVGFGTTRDTHTRLDQSNAEQIVTMYVTKDVQGADTVQSGVVSTCGGPAALETTTRTDPAGAVNVTVAYRLDGTSLVRQLCGPTPSTNTIATNVTSFSASGADPLSVNVATAAATNVPAYSWSFEVHRRQT